jgi:hypothetical protein
LAFGSVTGFSGFCGVWVKPNPANISESSAKMPDTFRFSNLVNPSFSGKARQSRQSGQLVFVLQ